MDIYIIRKCRIEMKEFPGTSGVYYKIPVMTKADLHSYVVKESLNPQQREKIQKDLEDFYIKSEV